MKIKYNGELDKLFFTSDSHFFHENIIKFSGRPFRSNEHQTQGLIRLWNETVPHDGTVVHCGDFFFSGDVNKIIPIICQLNGRIYWVLGNHDYQSKMDRPAVFDALRFKVEQMMDIASILVVKDNNKHITACHYPMLFWPRDSIMIHGHIHSGPNSNSSEKATFSPMRYDVGVDNCNYKPISYPELVEIIDNQKMQYLDNGASR